ncbi:twin-arginine translocase TatA/TatE family subunit [Curtanaerobium respiraculi]|uniref:twin-arginine translocase TatA/TatE family subunit n=1 Tax=Curtanaerobium respiraculi TaxID=2949669 RepID=UPI0024B38E02|nr:twin-arginine translocase TatA/TatE family subunit [Curtanaerobium respiraculi]
MKILGLFGPMELVIILVVVLLIFGPKNLPKLGSAIGKSVKNLREGMGKNAKESEESEGEVVEVVEEQSAPEAKQAVPAPKKKVVKKVVKKASDAKDE